MFQPSFSTIFLNTKKYSLLSPIHTNIWFAFFYPSGPKGCFQEPKMALCGNGVVEEGEECDCGWEDDCSEDCCWPQRTEYPSTEKPCTLKPKRDCSPSQGPCCTNSCTFNSGEKCLDDNGCREESFCDGTSSSCPLSQVKPNKTVCNKEFVCYKGECTGIIAHFNFKYK